MTPLYPLRFEPIFQYRLWGGRALGPYMHAQLPGDEPIGEAWILSDREDCASKVADGPLAGTTLGELMKQRKADILGRDATRFDRFPLLLKFLDVEKMLSVQVHPRDDQSDLIPDGDTGKTEAWIVLRSREGARIYAGLKPGTTPDDLKALTAKNADEYLPSFHPETGQALLIEAGTVHSLGDGVIVFEVQENSDTTFRLFDWDHIDAKTGKPRPLQVDKALAAIDFEQGPKHPLPEGKGGAEDEALIHDAHFAVTRRQGAKPLSVGAAGEARVLVCTEGAGRIGTGAEATKLARGDVVLLPAALGPASFLPDSDTTLLEISIPPVISKPEAS